jgi:hypothetical protein
MSTHLCSPVTAHKTVVLCVVRKRTSAWGDKRGIHQKVSLTLLQRKSQHTYWFMEDVNYMGANEIFQRIVNLNDCEDGVYNVIACNKHRDWETGTIEDYDYKLVELDAKEATP